MSPPADELIYLVRGQNYRSDIGKDDRLNQSIDLTYLQKFTQLFYYQKQTRAEFVVGH